MRRVQTRRAVALISTTLTLLVSTLAHAQQPLATASIQLLGVQLKVAADLTPPIDVLTNAPFALSTGLFRCSPNPSTPCTPISAASVFGTQTLTVHGRLRGQGLDTPVALATVALGNPLQIPRVATAGTYFVEDLYLTANGTKILDATPSVIELRALAKIFVSSVSSRALTLEEIQDRGIIIDPTNFDAVEFTFGIATDSKQVPITFPMLFPKDPAADGVTPDPPMVPELAVPSFDIDGFLLKGPTDLPGEPLPPIPGVIVIPGNIAFLHGFFQVQVLVSNVTPVPPMTSLVKWHHLFTRSLPNSVTTGDSPIRARPQRNGHQIMMRCP